MTHEPAPFTLPAGAFAVAAAGVAVARAFAPFAHGWWLVAFLALVGCASQFLLGNGLIALARRAGARPDGPAAIRAELVLWNAGTVLVAVADLAGSHAGVITGSVALLAALALFARGLRRVRATGHSPSTAPSAAYALFVVALAGSVVLGTGLAGALPGQ